MTLLACASAWRPRVLCTLLVSIAMAACAAPAEEETEGAEGASATRTMEFDLCKTTNGQSPTLEPEMSLSGPARKVTFKHKVLPKTISGFRVILSDAKAGTSLQKVMEQTTVKVQIGTKTYEAKGAPSYAIAHDGSAKPMEATVTVEFPTTTGAIQGVCKSKTDVCTDETSTRTVPVSVDAPDYAYRCEESLKAGPGKFTKEVLACKPVQLTGACGANGNCKTRSLGPTPALTYQGSGTCM